MKLSKDNLIRNCNTVEYTVAVIHVGYLSQEQARDKSPYMTLTGTKTAKLVPMLEQFCDDHVGHNFSMLLKNSSNSHGSGANWCQVELIEEMPLTKTETVQETFKTPSQGYRKSEAEIRKEIEQEYLLKDLQQQIKNLSLPKEEKKDTSNQLAIVGAQILKQLTSDGTPETDKEFLGLLNQMSGGALEKEVTALNGPPSDVKVNEEDIKTIVGMLGVDTIKQIAEAIRSGSFTEEKLKMMKAFIS